MKHNHKLYRVEILTLWSLKVNNSVVILEHVDLIDILELLHTELLEGCLKFLIFINLILVVNNLFGSSLGSYTQNTITI